MSRVAALALAGSLSLSSGFLVTPVPTRRTGAVTMMEGGMKGDKSNTRAGNVDAVVASFDKQAFREYEECVVDSENAEELAECNSMPSEPVKSAGFDMNSFASGVTNFFNRLTPQKLEIDIEECIVDAESAEERAACQ